MFSAGGGTESGDGGVVDIFNNDGTLSLSGVVLARARGTGNGGSVSIINFGTSQTVIDSDIRVQGGPTEGDGGSINIAVGGALSLAGAFNASADGSGNGGAIQVSAGGSEVASSGWMRADSEVSGTGGLIDIESAGDLRFVVEGDTGGLSARGGAQVGGDGGVITVRAQKNIEITANFVSVDARSGEGNAGDIRIESVENGIDIAGRLSASVTGDQGDAGNISLIAENGGVRVTGAVRADVHKGTGVAGNLLIVDGVVLGDIQMGDLSARQLDNGDGGRIVLISILGKIVAGNLSAQGGKSGGQIYLRADKTIQAMSLNANGLDGHGGSIVVIANNDRGGSIPFIVGGGATANGVSNSIKSIGTEAGGSGEATDQFIVMIDRGTGGIQIRDNGTAASVVLRTRGADNHASLFVQSEGGSITLPSELSVNGDTVTNADNSTTTYAAGSVYISGEKIIASAGSRVSANGSSGGQIAISTGEIQASPLLVLSANGQNERGGVGIQSAGNHSIEIEQVGFSVGGIEGFTQTVLLEQGDSRTPLLLSGGDLRINARGSTSGGGVSIDAADLQVNVPLRVNVSGTSNIRSDAGNITITASDVALNSHVTLTANGHNGGYAGEVKILVVQPDEFVEVTPLLFDTFGSSFEIGALGGRADDVSNIDIMSFGDIVLNGFALSLNANTGNSASSINVTSERQVRFFGAFQVNSTDGAGGVVAVSAKELDLTGLVLLQANGLTGAGRISLTQEESARPLSMSGVYEAVCTNLAATSGNGLIELINLSGDIDIAGNLLATGQIRLEAAENIAIEASGVPGQETIETRSGSVAIEAAGRVQFRPGASVSAVGGSVLVYAGGSTGLEGGIDLNEFHSTENLQIAAGLDGIVRLSGTPSEPIGVTILGTGNVIRADGGLESRVSLNTNANPQNVVIEGGVYISAMPVAFIQGSSNLNGIPCPVHLREFGNYSASTLESFQGHFYENSIGLSDGACFVEAKAGIKICMGSTEVFIPRAAVVSVSKSGQELSVRNLGVATVVVGISKSGRVELGAGQELVMTPAREPVDGIARRRRKMHKIGGLNLFMSEFSIVTAMKHDEILMALHKSDLREHQNQIQRLVKVAAALSIVTNKNGPFFRY